MYQTFLQKSTFSRAVSTIGEAPWQSWRGREPVLLSLTRAVARFHILPCYLVVYLSSLFVMMFLCLVLGDEWKWSMSWKCKSGECCNCATVKPTKVTTSQPKLPVALIIYHLCKIFVLNLLTDCIKHKKCSVCRLKDFFWDSLEAHSLTLLNRLTTTSWLWRAEKRASSVEMMWAPAARAAAWRTMSRLVVLVLIFSCNDRSTSFSRGIDHDCYKFSGASCDARMYAWGLGQKRRPQGRIIMIIYMVMIVANSWIYTYLPLKGCHLWGEERLCTGE